MCSRQDRTTELILFRASLLIAGTKPVVMRPLLVRTLRPRNPYPRNVNDVCSRRLHAGHHLASKRISARLIPESPKHPGSDVVLEFRHVSNDSLALAFPVPT